MVGNPDLWPINGVTSTPSGSLSGWRGCRASPACARRRRGCRSTSSAARSATCCSSASTRTSTSSSRATSPPWRRRSAASCASTSASRPRPCATDGAVRRPRAGPHGDLRAARARCPRSSPASIGEDLAPPRLHDQRDGGAAVGRAAADRSRTAASTTSRPGCCACCTRARSPTTRPGPCAPRATPRGSASSSSPRPRRCCATPTSSTVSARPRRAPSCCGWPPRQTRRAAFELLEPSGG